uniref:Uncharacterized protein n=1 Tax=Ascaris lumbricoides TaxID=6252 RepID=A0A0M3I0M3_ASCLU
MTHNVLRIHRMCCRSCLERKSQSGSTCGLWLAMLSLSVGNLFNRNRPDR